MFSLRQFGQRQMDVFKQFRPLSLTYLFAIPLFCCTFIGFDLFKSASQRIGKEVVTQIRELPITHYAKVASQAPPVVEGTPIPPKKDETLTLTILNKNAQVTATIIESQLLFDIFLPVIALTLAGLILHRGGGIICAICLVIAVIRGC